MDPRFPIRLRNPGTLIAEFCPGSGEFPYLKVSARCNPLKVAEYARLAKFWPLDSTQDKLGELLDTFDARVDAVKRVMEDTKKADANQSQQEINDRVRASMQDIAAEEIPF